MGLGNLAITAAIALSLFSLGRTEPPEFSVTAVSACDNVSFSLLQIGFEKTTVHQQVRQASLLTAHVKLLNASDNSHKEDANSDINEEANADTSMVLLGGIAFIMAIFYMVNAHHPLIVDNTWSMLSSAISIFCAVLTNNFVNSCVKYMCHLKDPADGSPPSLSDVSSSTAQLIIWWFSVIVILFILRGSSLHLKGYGTIFGHILGFVAINVFGQISLLEPFKVNAWMTLLDLGIYLIVMSCLFGSSIFCRKLLLSTHVVIEEDAERWHDQSKDTGVDFFCMCASFIISIWIRFLITGSVPPIDGTSRGRTNDDCWILASVGIALVVLAGLLAAIVGERMEYVRTTTSLTSAWCLFFSAFWWAIPRYGATVLSRTYIANFFSLVAIAFVLLMSILIAWGYASKRLLQGMFTGISLAVGLAWERVFDASLDGMAHFTMIPGTTPPDHKLNTTMLTAALVFVVYPAWLVYILPKTDDELKKKSGLPFWTAFVCSRSDTEELSNAKN